MKLRQERRDDLRKGLLALRRAFVAGSGFKAAEAALARHLTQLLTELGPRSLGLYWPHRCEFNAVAALEPLATRSKLPLLLPFAHRAPIRMHYRAWDRAPPVLVDECGIATASGAPAVPDVVLVPCVGFSPSGCRLGYGGGYFDRWLAQHPHVTAIGVAWAAGLIDDAAFAAEPHDRPMTLIVTEHGVV